MAASSVDELDDYMRRVEIVGSLLDLNGEAMEIDASTPRLAPEDALMAGGLGGLEGKQRKSAKKQAERKRVKFKKARDEARACAMGASTSVAGQTDVGMPGPMSPPFLSPAAPANPRLQHAEAQAKKLSNDKKNRGKTISRRDDTIDALQAKVTGLESKLADLLGEIGPRCATSRCHTSSATICLMPHIRSRLLKRARRRYGADQHHQPRHTACATLLLLLLRVPSAVASVCCVLSVRCGGCSLGPLPIVCVTVCLLLSVRVCLHEPLKSVARTTQP